MSHDMFDKGRTVTTIKKTFQRARTQILSSSQIVFHRMMEPDSLSTEALRKMVVPKRIDWKEDYLNQSSKGTIPAMVSQSSIDGTRITCDSLPEQHGQYPHYL